MPDTPNLSFTGIIGALAQIGTALAKIANTLGNSYISLAGANTFTGRNAFQSGLNFKIRVVTAAGAVTVATSDFTVAINKTVGAATTVNLPALPSAGDFYLIKDDKGDANVNNITITPAAGTIDGAATLVINTAHGKAGVQYNGTQWDQVI